MRPIDADAIPTVSADPYEEAAFRDTIDDMPTIDAVPVVRCKECCYFHEMPRLIGEERTDGTCDWIDHTLVEQDHYCSWGTERSKE